jgi:hypothetical protein
MSIKRHFSSFFSWTTLSYGRGKSWAWRYPTITTGSLWATSPKTGTEMSSWKSLPSTHVSVVLRAAFLVFIKRLFYTLLHIRQSFGCISWGAFAWLQQSQQIFQLRFAHSCSGQAGYGTRIFLNKFLCFFSDNVAEMNQYLQGLFSKSPNNL